jgi:APA family basic amino acid/polyamine antiporter
MESIRILPFNMKTKEKLSSFSLTMLVIGLVIGMGIFRTASDTAKAAGTAEVFFVAWILGGIVALCGALTFAEIGSRYPITGGYYKIFSVAFHPSIAYALNLALLVSNAAALSGVALIGSEYLCQVIFQDATNDVVKSMIAMLTIVLFYGINLLGLSISSRALNVLMFIKIGMILLLISCMFLSQPQVQNTALNFSNFLSKDNFLAIGAALMAVSFTYGGYQQTINFGEEIDGDTKVMPRGIVTGMFIIIALYVCVNYAYYSIIGFESLKEARGVASLVIAQVFGPFGQTAFSILLFIAVLAYVNVQLMANPRVMFAMSQEGLLPKNFQYKSKEKNVLVISLTVFATIAIIVLFFANTFEKILGFVMFLDSIGMAMSAMTLFIIKKKFKKSVEEEKSIYKMKLFPIPTLIFILCYLYISITVAIRYTNLALIGAGVFVLSLLIYFLIIQSRKK